MRSSSVRAITGLAAIAIVLGSTPLAGQQATDHDHSPAAAAKELAASRRRFSPELERIKSLAGRWEGTTFRASQGTNPAVMTYAITGAGSAVIETMFPGTAGEMTTVYHDDSSGRLVAEHYCNAANQPKLRLMERKENSLYFVLAPEADIKADLEGHAHELTITFGPDGSLIHDWLNHYLGKPAQGRNIELRKVK
jgi:hypothetical protein